MTAGHLWPPRAEAPDSFYVLEIYPALKAIAFVALLVNAACFGLLLVRERSFIAGFFVQLWSELAARLKGRPL